jgi:Cd2+/Zn2+-exporting ATPase
VEKVEELLKNRSSKGRLVFVGDGINDAPVLARADIGVAMGGVGSDAAIEAADVVLMRDEILALVEGIKIAKRTNKILWQNIIFSLGIKVMVLLLSTFGLANMWEGVFADVGVTLIAVFNSMRALRN